VNDFAGDHAVFPIGDLRSPIEFSGSDCGR
jgi:hypothetical protein